MKLLGKLFIAILILAFALNQCQAQSIDVSLGYGGGSHKVNGSKVGFGKAYLSVGERFGGTIFIGGDSRITYAKEKNGAGYVGLAAWYDLKEDDTHTNIRFSLGAEQVQKYVAIENSLAEFGLLDPNTGKAGLSSSRILPIFGVTFSYKFIELFTQINTSGTFTAGLGVKLNR